ncbi:MAG: DNA polymerase III subunit alpha [Erysipelotrichaceae bacterium]
MATLLYNKTCYSILDSLIKVEELVMFAKNNHYRSIAICDDNVLFGSLDFYDLCLKNNIKPIIGMGVKVKDEDKEYHFNLYAKNDSGYLALMKISSLIMTNRPFTKEDLIKYRDNLVICLLLDNNYMQDLLISNMINDLSNIIVQLNKEYSGIYVALLNNDSSFNKNQNKIIYDICQPNNILMVAMTLAIYVNPLDNEYYKVLKAIQAQVNMNNSKIIAPHNRFLYPVDQFTQLYLPQFIKNSDDISDMCNVNMQINKASLPDYCDDSFGMLQLLCQKGLIKRLGKNIDPKYQERLTYELNVINSMGFANYFLIVYDIISFAFKNNITTGVGRGSAGGSLVAYVLGITHIDPLKYDLIFERFLNPERISMPDIDTDFCDVDRDKIFDYLQDKYKDNCYSKILTFNTFKMKQAIRDVGKALGYNGYQVDSFVRLFDERMADNLIDSYKNNLRLQKIIDQEDDKKKWFKIALKLENMPRNLSIHAAGVVISKFPIDNYVPLVDVNGVIATQYPMNSLERFGLIKIDILSLKNLTILDNTLSLANSKLDIKKIPLDDQKVFKLLQKGLTAGLFQLESSGMTDTIMTLKPECFNDIAHCIAIYRPGTKDNIKNFINNKLNYNKINYLHPKLKTILEPTYGIIVYQEQVMQIAQVMAGFSLGKADIFRKAISKKNMEIMVSLKKEFIAGSIELGYSVLVANEVYNLIERFANYGFNKSHSIAYAMIAYQCAYLKVNFPKEFYCSLFNNVIGDDNKIKEYYYEALKLNIKFKLPNINFSLDVFSINDNFIQMPLTMIKGIGNVVVNSIIKERENGLFVDYIDCIIRLVKNKTNIKILQSLIKAGCLDDFKLNRTTMLNNLSSVIDYGNLVKVEDVDQISFNFDIVSKPNLTIYQDISSDLSSDEKECYGFYLTAHPTTRYLKHNKLDCVRLSQCHHNFNLVFVLIIRIKYIMTKNNEKMAFVTLEDASGELDVAIMPDKLMQYQSKLVLNRLIYCEIRLSSKDKYLINKVLEY